MDKAVAKEQLAKALKDASRAYSGYDEGVEREQVLEQYAGFLLGRFGNLAKPAQLKEWLAETGVNGKFEAAAENVLAHLETAGKGSLFYAGLAAQDQLILPLEGTVDKVPQPVPLDELFDFPLIVSQGPEVSPSPDLDALATALRSIDTLTIPSVLANHKIEYDGPGYLTKHFDKIPTIYGFNTLPGHRANEKVPDADLVKFQFNLIANHKIGDGPYLEEKTARAVTYAKLFAAASGNTLITKPLYEEMLQAAVSPDFKPDIPAHASYSAGDVIPAAHWAQDLLDWEKKTGKKPSLQPGEGMALINGSFVHVGVTLSLVRQLHDFWGMYVDTAAQSFRIVGSDARVLDEPSVSDRPWFTDTINYVKKNLEGVQRSSEVQDPVAIRAFPQQTQAAIFAISNLMSETAAVLNKPSGNPIMHWKEDGKLAVTPSGSFDQASLALATSNVIEALLMLAWNSVRRTVHMLDGLHGDLPKDGATDTDHLAMIQWPKLAQAMLEDARTKYGIHNFTSGSATSDGIEDFWTNGTETSLKAIDLLNKVESILMIERQTAKRMAKVINHDPTAADIGLSYLTQIVQSEKTEINAKKIPFPLKL